MTNQKPLIRDITFENTKFLLALEAEDVVQAAIIKLLSELHATCTLFHSKAAVLDIFKAEKIDIVCILAKSPDYNVIDLLAQIKKSKEYRSIPCLILTRSNTNELDDLRHNIVEILAQFITLPFGPYEFVQIADVLLKRKQRGEKMLLRSAELLEDKKNLDIAYSEMSEGYAILNQLSKAITCLHKAIDISRGNDVYLRRIATLYDQQGDYKTSQKYWKKAQHPL